jgi:CDP-2,3-bis-(O-geranylgeranyl)-sn-glycerol synthase
MISANTLLIFKLLFLLFLANGTPVLAKRLLGSRLAYPLDAGKDFFDGQPLFGVSKTYRGAISSVLVTAAGAALVGYSMATGALFALASLAGDLVSSFIKRRMDLEPSSRTLVLDQLPESILPLVFLWQTLGLSASTAATTVIAFFVGEIVLSKVLFRLNIRDHPY